MLNNKILIPLGALLLVNIGVVAARRPTCPGCFGNSLVKLIDVIDEKTQCWLEKYQNVLVKEKIVCLDTIEDAFKKALQVNNDATDEKCKTDVQVTPCDMEDPSAKSKCLTTSIKTLIQAYIEQEKCHGKAFKSAAIKLMPRFMKGYIRGWSDIHPNC